MYSVLIHPDAYHDVDEIMAWYESQKRGLGIDFLVKFDEAVATVKQDPFLFQADFLHFRRILLSVFPYKIYYAIDESKQQIQIIAVFHQRQNPDSIEKRLGK